MLEGDNMPDYKQMHFKLYSAHSKVLDILNQVTLETEQIAMDEKAPPLVLHISTEDEDG